MIQACVDGRRWCQLNLSRCYLKFEVVRICLLSVLQDSKGYLEIREWFVKSEIALRRTGDVIGKSDFMSLEERNLLVFYPRY